MSLNHLSGVRNLLVRSRRFFLRKIIGMDIHPTVQFSLSAKFDMTFPKGIHVAEYSYIAFGSRILCHDRTRGLYLHTRIGKNCFVGGESLILPGITIGDNCVIGAGSVVTKDVPARCAVAGNPAKIIRTEINVERYGRFADADSREREIRQSDPTTASVPDRIGTKQY